MDKSCGRCGTPIQAGGNRRYCGACKLIRHGETRESSRRKEDPGKARDRNQRYRERHADILRQREQERLGSPTYVAKRQVAHDRERFGGLRRAVLNRDGHCCRVCQEPHHLGKRNLVVHHIDGDKTNNTMANLITLCRSCHPKKHAGWTEDRRQRHSEAMKQAGAGKWMTGRSMPPEVVAKIATANRGRRNSPEAVEKMRAAKREWWAKQTAERKAEIARKRRSHRNS